MIEIKNVSKTYPTGIEANHDISFCVNSGEIISLVGPNGSGKTTLMQQILGVIKLGSGSILIDGRENNSSMIAYVPQFPAIYPALTVEETLKATAMYLGLPKKLSKKNIENALLKTKLASISKQPCYTLSGGQKKLLSFACILVQDSPNIVMDEVTSMVDAVTKELIWQLIIEEQKRGKAILISSHDLLEVKKLCTELIVMQKGRIVFAGSPNNLSEKFCHCEFSVSDIIAATSLFSNSIVKPEETNGKLCLLTHEIASMLDAVRAIDDAGLLVGFNCEYPAVYEGVINLMKERTFEKRCQIQ